MVVVIASGFSLLAKVERQNFSDEIQHRLRSAYAFAESTSSFGDVSTVSARDPSKGDGSLAPSNVVLAASAATRFLSIPSDALFSPIAVELVTTQEVDHDFVAQDLAH